MFVDDEAAVLRALASLFRRDRDRWDVVYAHGGAQALLELDRARFDVIVTDLSMPEVDGLQLLQAVLASSPRTTRIMLSGGAESTSVFRALPLVHQFLAKPCEITMVRAAIERAANEPADRSLADRIGGLRCLPSPRTRIDALCMLAADPDTTLEQMIDVVSVDPALAAKVMQIASSTYFIGGNHTIPRAVATLGLDVMRDLASSSMVREPIGLCARVIDQLTERSVRAAGLARRVSSPGTADAAYVATLLDNIGQLALADLLGDSYAPVLDRVTRTGESLADVEAELLGVTHETVGARLRAMWALP
jgi:DNA-binding NarL/FixJ family response regulator